MSISDIPTEHWVTTLTDPPNVHQWYAAPDEPIHEASADCACGPVPSPLSTGGELYLHQTVMPDPSPAPLPEGETHEEVPHAFVLVDTTQTPQVVIQTGSASTAAPPSAEAGQAWVDVTGVKPKPRVGWTYDGTSFSPSQDEQLVAQAKQALNANATFLNLSPPTNVQVLQQVQSLTRQVNGLIRLSGQIMRGG